VLHDTHLESFGIIWDAAVQLIPLSAELMKLSEIQVAEYIRSQKTDSDQWFRLHSYLTAVLEDSKGYPLFENNRRTLRKIFDRMVTYETIVQTDEGLMLIPKQGTS
jgi:hypothetical protein